MKKSLEQIGNTMFRELDHNEELGAVGGFTGGPTRIVTDLNPTHPDIILDFRVDPNFPI